MFANLSGPTMILIVFVVLLLFGAPKLPGLAKSLGQSMKILRKEASPVLETETPATDAAGSDASGAVASDTHGATAALASTAAAPQNSPKKVE